MSKIHTPIHRRMIFQTFSSIFFPRRNYHPNRVSVTEHSIAYTMSYRVSDFINLDFGHDVEECGLLAFSYKKKMMVYWSPSFFHTWTTFRTFCQEASNVKKPTLAGIVGFLIAFGRKETKF